MKNLFKLAGVVFAGRLLAVMLAAGFCSALAMAASPGMEASLDTGVVRGSVQDGVIAFNGIPFAAPPVGDLRWRAPQPATAWQGVRSASEYGPDCMQLPFVSDAAPLVGTPSEDCLYLNVWKPAKPSAHKRPVMVWIYGGGFVNGGTSSAVYDGSQFAKRDVLLISFNYRMGRFGFFAHPALTAEGGDGLLGNYAFMDQLAALQWVRRNAAAFGGDPNNVTVFGESAGGISVNMLLTSPLAQGLFQKAIVQSGGGRNTLMPMRPLSQKLGGATSGEALGLAFAKTVGVADEGARGLAALRALPADKIVDGLNLSTLWTVQNYSGPMIDGRIMPIDLETAFRQGKHARVPLMLGANSGDGFFFGRTLDDALAPAGAERAAALAIYDPQGLRNPMAIGSVLAGDQGFIEPARFVARAFNQHATPVYVYRFSYVAESMRKEWFGVPHAAEIPFVFDTMQARYGDKTTPQDRAAAKATQAYWVAFARTGKPSAPGLPAWPAYRAQDDVLMDFALSGARAVKDPWHVRLDFTAAQSEKAAQH